MQSLKEKFAKFVGRSVRDPSAYSNEECPTRYALELEANNARLAVIFYESGRAVSDPEFVRGLASMGAGVVKVALAETPAHGWHIESVDLG